MAGIKFLDNPLSGELNVNQRTIPESEIARRVILDFDCLATTAVHDPVYQDPGTAGRVLSNTDNTEVEITIGVVIEKPTTTTCKVLVLGLEDGFSGQSIGDKVFLSTSGGLTNTAPSTGYQQVLGVAITTTQILFTPNSTRVLKT